MDSAGNCQGSLSALSVTQHNVHTITNLGKFKLDQSLESRGNSYEKQQQQQQQQPHTVFTFRTANSGLAKPKPIILLTSENPHSILCDNIT